MLVLLAARPMYLKDIDLLVFNSKERTKSRRGEYLPQLKAESGSFKIRQAVCKNSGYDGENVIWKCTSNDLPKDQQFLNAKVSCEGWNGPGDVQIVPGSCQLKYKVIQNRYDNDNTINYDDQDNSIVFLLLIVLAIIFIAYFGLKKITHVCLSAFRNIFLYRPIYIREPVQYIYVDNRKRRICSQKRRFWNQNDDIEYCYVNGRAVYVYKDTEENKEKEVYARTDVR